MNLVHELLDHQLSGAALEQLGRTIGATPEQTRSAATAAIPALVSALARNSAKPHGAEALHAALQSGGHDGGLLDDVMGFLGNPAAANGAGILGHLFGGRQDRVQGGLARGTGLSPAAMATLMTILAPLVMSVVGRAQRQQNLDAAGLADLLDSQHAEAHDVAPEFMTSLGNLFDPNHDGTVVDNLGGLAARLFGGKKSWM